MNFALIGFDESAIEFAHVALADGAAMTALVQFPGESFANLFPEARLLTSVEQLAGVSHLDFLVLAGPYAGRADRLRSIAQLPPIDLVFAVPIADKADSYYELAIHVKSAAVRAMPLLREGPHSVLKVIRSHQESSGPVHWFETMHPLDVSVKGPRRFLEGWTWLREIVGEIESVTATGSEAEKLDADQVMVAVRCDSGVLGQQRWVRGADAKHTLTFRTANANFEIIAPLDFNGNFILRTNRDGTVQDESIADEPVAQRWWQQWKQLKAEGAQDAMLPAIRQIEIGVGIMRSLKYQRTVALDREEVSEEAVFKSIMASTGCGLVWTLILLAILIAAKVPYVGYAVLPILLLFLGFQLFGLVYRKSNTAAADGAARGKKEEE